MTTQRSRRPQDDPASRSDRLLDGESSANVHDPVEIRHWMTVYAELVSHKERLLEVSTSYRARLSSAASIQAAGRVDHELFGGRLEQYRRRLGFWTLRFSEVGG